jgi:hypothetical protein
VPLLVVEAIMNGRTIFSGRPDSIVADVGARQPAEL